jgi:methylenetetrahydrofolate reductase (NADPH)
VAVSPFKKLEAEVLAQYFKLHKKLKMGADFVITQVGFDARKFDELLKFMRGEFPKAPVLGNVYILNRPVARVMNRGDVPGCVVPDDLCRFVEKEAEAPDKGRAARLRRAAKLVAVLRGLGFDGVHLGGPNLKYEDVEWVVEKSKEFSADWEEWVREFDFPQKEGFYLFKKDPRSGLNSGEPNALSAASRKKTGFRLMRFMHHFVFLRGAPLYQSAGRFFSLIDGSRAETPVTEAEYFLKFLTSRCRRCGDCTLAEMAFLCPQSQCAKFLFNGQCGGSRDGWCEVFPGKKKCIYVRGYGRLKSFGEEKSLREGYIPPRNWALDQTSSWANYFLGRDHHAVK